MNNTNKIEITDIRSARGIFKRIGLALLTAFIISWFKFGDWKIILIFFGIAGSAGLVGIMLREAQGTLTSMEIINDELLINYEYILKDRKKTKSIKLHTITNITYSGFRTLLTIKTSTETVNLMIRDSEKTPVKAFTEIIKTRMIRRQL